MQTSGVGGLYSSRVILNFFHRCLQGIQEACGLATIKLGMVELERNCQRCLEPMSTISPPNEKRIVEDARVLVDNAVQFCADYGRSANYHGIRFGNILTSLDHLSRARLVVETELLQVISNRFSEEYAKDCIKVLLKHNNQVNISLHRINYVTDKEINYQTEDLFIK